MLQRKRSSGQAERAKLVETNHRPAVIIQYTHGRSEDWAYTLQLWHLRANIYFWGYALLKVTHSIWMFK
ncbi:unnamed protein product [Allacma fusca]|uniref:Uncharacterized protein n=1 Tax=Allacma fusca TaxID=39272 RepID=A0A8J2LI06_9HEXA|nr:unnamed protein product [Allacma fusca]